MPRAKVAVSIDSRLLRDVDGWVAAGDFPSRSQAVNDALAALKERRSRRGRLLRELTKLSAREVARLAEERLEDEAPWPAY